ncbi:MAG: hypothetical protein JST16_04760 [Bdellovibrionales bacterium]|nr:hypothetical protein [Bdellovibrionales bacterium]
MKQRIVAALMLLAVTSSSVVSSVAFAQGAAPAPAPSSGSSGTPDFDARDSVGTILIAGLAGGILGLSTLSFYDKPQDNIRNITIGAGIGMIAAAIYLTANVATNTKVSQTTSSGLPSGVAPLVSTDFGGLLFTQNF